MTELERRDLVVSGALQRHQMRQWLNASGIGWEERAPFTTPWALDDYRFSIEATPQQWEQINEWVKQVKG